MLNLPMLPRSPTCPAALAIAGASASQQGVVCRVMQRDYEQDAGVRMSAGVSGFIQHEATGGAYLNLKSDPSSVTAFCHGDAVPVVTDEDGQGRASYTYCSVWQAEKRRIEAGDAALYVEEEPEEVAMGVEPVLFDDPWQRARADLGVLAPAQPGVLAVSRGDLVAELMGRR